VDKANQFARVAIAAAQRQNAINSQPKQQGSKISSFKLGVESTITKTLINFDEMYPLRKTIERQYIIYPY